MKTQNIYYKDINNPTTAELYAVLLNNLAIVDITSFNTPYSMCKYYGSCEDCPFSDDSIDTCYLDSDEHIHPALALLQQSHPELLL